jgi:hypothetical protein
LSVTPESEPAFVSNRTVAPPAVSSLPLASTAWTVMVEVEVPSAAIDVGFAEIVEFAADTAPGVNATDASPDVIVFPLIVPLTSAVPVVVGLVSVAV